ncbi:MAG: hypothetical protein WCF12_14385 [Propionicimonas sp.]
MITATRRAGVSAQILVRADSGYFQPADIAAITKTGAWFSIGARQDPAVQRAIAAIPSRRGSRSATPTRDPGP